MRVALRPSLSLFVIIGATTALAVVALLLADLPPELRAAGSALAISAAVPAVRLHALRRGRSAVLAIEADSETTACKLIGTREENPGAMLPDSVIWPWLILIRVRTEGAWRARTIVILPDAVTPDEWRRLSIWLRWAVPP